MFLPYEIIILGVMLHNKINNVTYKQVNEYIKRRQFNLELDEDFTNFEFVEITDKGFCVDKIPPIHPQMKAFLAQ